MKIAKRVLAVVMAIAMIAGLSAMAFAADASYSLSADAVKDGAATVTVSVAGPAEFTDFDLTIKYDPAQLEYKGSTPAAGASAENAAGNTYASLANDQGGTISYSGYFLKEANASSGLTLDNFSFALKDGVKEATVSIEGGSSVTIKAPAEQPKDDDSNKTPAEQPKDTDKKDDTKKEDPSKSVIPDKGGKNCKPAPKPCKDKAPKKGNKNTGDNMALAAAGAVVVLAGAAFVISKKKRG